jgi:cytochrome c553
MALLFISGGIARGVEGPGSQAPLTFEEHIRPILKAACFRCHGGEGQAKGNLDMRLRRNLVQGGDSGPAIEPGQRNGSLLYARTSAGEMPPTDHKLSKEEIELIGRWIDTGAPTKRDEPEQLAAGLTITPEDRQFWSFQPIQRPAVPQPAGRQGSANPIDAFLLEALVAAEADYSPPAEKLTLLLRASFDLLGLPPGSDEVETFLNDTGPDAYERLIDRLLASPHYGERWGRHWLDAAGYAESDGYVDEDRPRPYAYKYRDYVIRSFNADKPLDQFIVEQLAGDELIAPPYTNLQPEQIEKLVATGYLRMAADGTGTAAIDEDLARNQTLADTIKIVSTSLLGLTVGCAQCHDHRYDPILQSDYYRLRAIFEPAYNWKAWKSRQERLISLYTDADRAKAQAVDAEASKIAAEREKKQAEYIAAALEKELEKFAPPQRDALRTAFNTPADKRSPEQMKLLDDNPSLKITPGVLYQYNQAAADELKKFDAQIAQVQQQKPVEDFIQALTEVPGQVPATFVFHRGDYHQPLAEVPPGELTICTPEGQPLNVEADAAQVPTTGRRLAYARWLTSGRHPLVARVLVNRVWMHHFGQGIVATPGDFGRMGQRPSHPELLDWLACELVEGGWRLKRMHKLIMTSEAYRQSSRRDAAKDAVDPDNRLLGRASVRRLDAEALRDRILATSGALNRKMFGPSVPVTQDGVGQIIVAEAKVPDTADGLEALRGGEESRRSIYLQVRRSQPIALLRAFDAPVMETNCDRRASSTVSPQALMLMNSQFIVTEAKRFALRVWSEAGPQRKSQIVRAWQLAYCRRPRDEEAAGADEFLTRQIEQLKSAQVAESQAGALPPEMQALTDLCQTLLGSNEFLYVD